RRRSAVRHPASGPGPAREPVRAARAAAALARVGGEPTGDQVVLPPRGRPRQDRPLRASVSPRSSELLARANDGLASAQVLVDARQAATAVSAAYYAMLYAARAALSERDQHARSQ